MFSPKITMMLQICMFLGDDSLLAFKGTIVYSIGIYSIMLAKLVMQDPRPYWNSKDITLNHLHCNLSYGNPSDEVFVPVFFWTYTIYMRFWKYSDNQSKVLITGLYSVLFLCLIG